MRVDGVEVTELDDAGLSELRRDTVSYVFQTFGLLPALTAAENVGVPLRLRRTPVAEREQRVALLLDLVGLRDHALQRPAELSGGQQQRVAIARALAGSPRLLIADEPTGQLDAETGLAVMALLRGIVESEGVTAVVATHDAVMVSLADRVLTHRRRPGRRLRWPGRAEARRPARLRPAPGARRPSSSSSRWPRRCWASARCCSA